MQHLLMCTTNKCSSFVSQVAHLGISNSLTFKYQIIKKKKKNCIANIICALPYICNSRLFSPINLEEEKSLHFFKVEKFHTFLLQLLI